MKYIFCSTLALFLLSGCSPTDCCSLSSGKKNAETNCKNENDVSPTVLITTEDTNVPIEETVVIDAGISHDDEEQETETNEAEEDWISLFDGNVMTNWTVPIYGGDGNVDVQEGNIVIGRGEMMTGIRYEKDFPKIDYEIRYEARRTNGYDFFGACTFPVKESFCTLINGGWGGGLTGLSSVDGYDASENSTSTHYDYLNNTWYRFCIRVTNEKILVWISSQNKEGNWGTEQMIVELEMEERNLSTRFEVDKYKPLGFCTWTTEGQLRNIEYRKIAKSVLEP